MTLHEHPTMSTFAKLTAVVYLFVIGANAILTREEATHEGLIYFQGVCAKQVQHFAHLLKSIEHGDLSGAIKNYVASRPYYEEIETLANSFENIDSDIDARPYAFEFGEDSKDFRGFHRIERLLYRDQNTRDALEPARTLKQSIDALCVALKEKKRFSPRKSWDGILALALEVPAKKISSEEEAWSDLSLMIFRSNFRGIYSQYKPFAKLPFVSVKSAAQVDAVYADIEKLFNEIDSVNGFAGNPSGAAKSYSTVSMLERRAIIELAYKFHAALKVVHVEVFKGVPMPSEESKEVESLSAQDKNYPSELSMGLKYFSKLCSDQQKSTKALHEALKLNDLRVAIAAYRHARPPYEQIETLAGNFEEEDTEIDARPYAIDGGETSEDFVGFHMVERALYRDMNISHAIKYMPRLRNAVDSLCAKLKKQELFSTHSQWDGILALAYEVPAKKISSEEETWSDLSIMIFRENAKGIHSQVKPYLSHMPKEVARDIEMKFNAIKHMFMYDIDRQNTWEGNEFVLYSRVPIWKRKEISDKFYDLTRSLTAARTHL